jgi:hypothetical protein
MAFEHLYDNQTWRPLGQRFRMFPYYLYPTYRKNAWQHKTPFKAYLIRLVGGLALLKVGYELGLTDSVDEGFEGSTVVPFECEEQIFDYLFNKSKTAVFL